MSMSVTERLAAYLDGLPYPMEELARRAGGGVYTWYRIRRDRRGWLTDRSAKMLARGLGISQQELLGIAMGPVKSTARSEEEWPVELRELCAAFRDLDPHTQNMVLAMAKAALKKCGGSAGCGPQQDRAQSA
jgi:hypothetical protein